MVIEAVQVIQDLAIVMLVALAMAALFHWIRQPLLIGYILAGMIVGPYTPPFPLVLHPEIINLFAEIGIVFLLFAIGLEYPVARLRAIGRTALIIALSEALLTFLAGVLVGQAFGLPRFDSLFLGLAVSVTSTVILAKVLGDLKVIKDDVAGLILGITVIEDIVAVSVLGVLQSVATTGSLAILPLGIGVGIVVVFVVATLWVGSRTVPKFVDWIAGTGRDDLLVIGILAIAFGLSFLSNLIGISVASGAFFAGVLVAESKHQEVARGLLTPLKELFGAIFFVSMGALMDIGLIPAYALLIASLIVASISVKLVTTYLAARGQGVSPAAARTTALGLAGPRGELSLVVAKGGADVSATGSFVLPVVGAVTLITSFLTAYLVRIGWPSPDSIPPAAAGGK